MNADVLSNLRTIKIAVDAALTVYTILLCVGQNSDLMTKTSDVISFTASSESLYRYSI